MAGKLQLDESVARVWPEFGVNGKQVITLRQLLSHQAGLPAVRQPLPPEALYDWEAMTAALAAETPWWTPGECHGYAAITYGWLLGELIRRADGREPGEAIVARTARPLGLDFHIGLADSEFDRVGYLTREKNNLGDAAAQRVISALMSDPQSLTALAFTNPPSIMNSANKPEWRRMAQPAANGHGNARSLAGFYDGLLRGGLLDYQLLDEMVDHGVPVHTEPNVLQQLVLEPGKMRSMVNAVTGGSQVGEELPQATLGSVPWRRENVRYNANELYVDIVEQLSAVVDGPRGRRE